MSFADFCAVLSLEFTKSKKTLQVIPSKNSPLSPKRKEGCFIKHVVEKNIPPCVKRRTGDYSIGRVMSDITKILPRGEVFDEKEKIPCYVFHNMGFAVHEDRNKPLSI